ncbi:MAG: 4Fe-4S dicluster domain-containing protein [Elusimicrobiota bacterium]|jgi:formate hydrogenlyase subunit 6/NADH:ubiquinone oxidoreductase subunit I
MQEHFLAQDAFEPFLAKLLAAGPVVGPVAKRSQFVFAKLESAADLRLDYDVTILPPKKLFFPPAQDLVRFDGDKVEGCIDPVPMVLFGVHPYDVKAIDMTDLLFKEKNADRNYLANRDAATIVAMAAQKASSRAFWGSIAASVEPKGHDALLTKVSGGWVYEPRTSKGAALLKHGDFKPATKEQSSQARKANEEAGRKCPETLKHPAAAVAHRMKAAFKDEKLWEELSEDCFSCGSCNTVCPTCYCFDVQDVWNLDQKSGSRTRYWDACLTEDFSKVTLGANAAENFRETRGERFRHRFMRKASYLNEKLGGPACVGCGRCSAACTADIADPVRVIDTIMGRPS